VSEQQKPKTELLDILVTEIEDASKFYIQVLGPEQKQLEELMKNLTLLQQKDLSEPYNPVVGELVIAKFTEDEGWYRGKILKKTPEGEYDVFYVDYGNFETLSNSRIRQIPPEFTALPYQAKEARLAYVRIPSLNDEFWS